MPIMENNDKVATTEKAFTAAFLGLCRALEHQKILMPNAIAQEIFIQRNMLTNDPDSTNVKRVLETITKRLEEPATPIIST
jgi:hypothetical protein